MHFTYRYFILFAGLGGLLFASVSCNKDDGDSPDDNTVATPTLYKVNLPNSLPPPALPDDNPLTVEGVALGNKLFFDKQLSGDGSMSCGSCHNQEFAFTDEDKALSEGIRGLNGKRNSMPIFNLAWHKEFFWDGRASSLREQVLMPIQDELEMDETLENVVAKVSADADYPPMFEAAFGSEEVTEFKISLAMEQYLHSIISGESKYDRVRAGQESFTAEEQRGFELFFTERDPNNSSIQGADCFHCHGGALLTNNEYMNNGLESESEWTDLGRFEVTQLEVDKAKFKVPSLRNIEVTPPYMHDGRFNSLEEVVEHYNSGIQESPTLDPNMHSIKDGMNLSDEDKAALIAFMKTMTDNAYLNNTEYHEN